MESGGMIGEIDIAGIFISPLLLCLLVAFFARLLVSRLLDALGFYRIVWQRPLFDLALFFLLVWLAFAGPRSEEHTSELQSLMRISYAVFCLKKKNTINKLNNILTNKNTRYKQITNKLQIYEI